MSSCASASTLGWSSTELDASISFRAFHRVEGSTLHLRLVAATVGWLGFGFAEASRTSFEPLPVTCSRCPANCHRRFCRSKHLGT